MRVCSVAEFFEIYYQVGHWANSCFCVDEKTSEDMLRVSIIDQCYEGPICEYFFKMNPGETMHDYKMEKELDVELIDNTILAVRGLYGDSVTYTDILLPVEPPKSILYACCDNPSLSFFQHIMHACMACKNCGFQVNLSNNIDDWHHHSESFRACNKRILEHSYSSCPNVSYDDETIPF